MQQETKPQAIAGVFTLVTAPDIQAAAAGMVQTAKDIESALPDLRKALNAIPSISGEEDKKTVKKVLARLNAHTKQMSESRKGLTRHLDAAKAGIQALEEEEMSPNSELIARAKALIADYDAKVEAHRQEELRKAQEAVRKAEEEAEALRKKDEAQRAAVSAIIEEKIAGLRVCMESSLAEKSLEKLETCAVTLTDEDIATVGKYESDLRERFQKLLEGISEAKRTVRDAIENPPEITLVEDDKTEELMDQKLDEYVAFVSQNPEVEFREDYEDKVADRARREAERAAEVKAKLLDDRRKEEALKANSREAFASYEITDFEALPKDLIEITFKFQQIRRYLVEHGAVPGLRVVTTNNTVFE